jgi:hypothetical protein
MAVPRPVLLALLGLALCAAAFMATRGAREPGGNAVTATPVAPAPATHKTHKAAPGTHKAAPATHKAAKHAPKAEVHKVAKPQPQPKPAVVKPQQSAAQRLVVKVTSALAQHKAVIFFFSRPGAADDTGTREAVRAVAGNPRVLVVRAGLKDLSTFGPVLSGAGVSQVPAVVVAHAGKQARLVQGYVDPGTLRQTVADALR